MTTSGKDHKEDFHFDNVHGEGNGSASFRVTELEIWLTDHCGELDWTQPQELSSCEEDLPGEKSQSLTLSTKTRRPLQCLHTEGRSI